MEEADANIVAVGSRVRIRVNEGEPDWFEIVGFKQSDPHNKKISYNSPLGAAIFGKRAGEEGVFVVNGKDIRVAVLDVKKGSDSS